VLFPPIDVLSCVIDGLFPLGFTHTTGIAHLKITVIAGCRSPLVISMQQFMDGVTAV